MVVGEVIGQLQSDSTDSDRVLELLNVMAPELSIAERRRALEALTGLSSDGSWDEGDSVSAVSQLYQLATGVPLDAQARASAASELAGGITMDSLQRIFGFGG